ncbi:MAG: CsiV family protein [Permianibacter sp.]
MKLRSLLAALLTLSLASTAQAADRWYEVEVLVFSHLNADVTAERWPANDAVSIALEGSVPAPNTITTPLASGAPSAQELLRLAAVPPAQFKLQDAYKTLSRARQYRPLLHTAWRQPIGTGKNQFKVRLAGGKDYASRYGLHGKLLSTGDEPSEHGLWEVDGYVQLTATRFLHAETELIFRRPTITAASTATTAGAGSNLSWQTGDAALVDEDWLQFFKLQQGRRVKANELHYFDHPMFGMLIVLRPLEPERG